VGFELRASDLLGRRCTLEPFLQPYTFPCKKNIFVKAEQVLLGWAGWYQFEGGSGWERGQEGECSANTVYTCM
jgi:hypothetical protein